MSMLIGTRRACACLLLAVSLVPTACGHKTSSAQPLRTCVDRWNQGNMAGWGPAPANVGLSPGRSHGAFLDRAALGSAVLRRDPRGRWDVDMCARQSRRLLVPATPRTHRAAADREERDDRCSRCAPTRLAAERHESDAGARLAALPARGRLHLALDTRWNTPPRAPLRGQGPGPLLPCRRDGQIRDQLPQARRLLGSTRASRSGGPGEPETWPRADRLATPALCGGRSRRSDPSRRNAGRLRAGGVDDRGRELRCEGAVAGDWDEAAFERAHDLVQVRGPFDKLVCER